MVIKRPAREESKVNEVCQQLRDLALQLGTEAQFPSMRTLYTELGTNRITLGEALRILEAEQVLYRKERQGIYVSPKLHQKSIHILFNESIYASEPVSPFWHLLWTRLAQEAKRRRALKNEVCTFHLIMPSSGETGEDRLPVDIEEQLRSSRIDGILTILLGTSNHHWLTNRSLPCVTFAGSGDWLVNIDTRFTAQMAVKELARLGCTRLGIWVLKYPTFHLDERGEYKGFRDTLLELDLPFYPELVREPVIPSSWELPLQEQGYRMTKAVFATPREQWPDGLFITDDMFTDGALVALEELGMQVGKDIQIVSHANTGSPMLFGRPKHLTLLENDPAEIAQSMFSLLDQQMANPTLPRQSIHISPHIKYHHAFHTD